MYKYNYRVVFSDDVVIETCDYRTLHKNAILMLMDTILSTDSIILLGGFKGEVYDISGINPVLIGTYLISKGTVGAGIFYKRIDNRLYRLRRIWLKGANV